MRGHLRQCALVQVHRNALGSLFGPSRRVNMLLVGESGAVVPLLTNAAPAPRHPSRRRRRWRCCTLGQTQQSNGMGDVQFVWWCG